MGGALFLLFFELLRWLLTALSVIALVAAPIVLYKLARRLARGDRRRRGLLWGLLAVPPLLAVGAVAWLRADGWLDPDRSLRTLRPGVGPIQDVAASEDGTWIFVAGGAGRVALCSVGPPSRCRRARSGEMSFENVAVSTDARLLAATTPLCELSAWRRSGDSLEPLLRTELGESGCQALEFSPAGHLHASWLSQLSSDRRRPAWGNALYRLEPESGEIIARFGEPVPSSERYGGGGVRDLPIHTATVTGFDFWRGGEVFVSSSWDGTAKLWQAGSTAPLRSFGEDALWLTDVALGPNRVVAGRSDGHVVSWDLDSGRLECLLPAHRSPLLPPLSLVNAVDYSVPRGLTASGSFDRRLTIGDPAACEVVAWLTGHRHAVTGVEIVRGGELIVTSSMDGTVKLWEVPSAAKSAAE